MGLKRINCLFVLIHMILVSYVAKLFKLNIESLLFKAVSEWGLLSESSSGWLQQPYK